jgi:spore coat protein CotH
MASMVRFSFAVLVVLFREKSFIADTPPFQVFIYRMVPSRKQAQTRHTPSLRVSSSNKRAMNINFATKPASAATSVRIRRHSRCDPLFRTYWLRLLVLLPLCAATLIPVLGASNKTPVVPGADLFVPAPLKRIEIEVKKEDVRQLKEDDRQYVRATFRDGTTVLENVGIHIKGSAGSRRSFNDRPAITVNFDKFTTNQSWHGLKKIHLNNSVQDNSLLTENICGELFRQAGIPAARACNARFILNGRDLGVYVLKEGLDKTFIKQYYRNAHGNFYDGGFCQDIDQTLEKHFGNDSKDQPELKALWEAAEEPDLTRRFQKMRELLDFDRFLDFCALEVLTWDWDGYALKPNNYKLYWNSDTRKITFLPHGMDQMFSQPDGPLFPDFSGHVAQALLETPEGKKLYRQHLTAIATNVFKVDAMTNRVNAYATHIRAAMAANSASEARDYDEQVKNLRELISARVTFVNEQLHLTPPTIPAKKE